MIKLIKEVPLWNNGYVQQYDFSEANSSEESRIEHVCAVARVCRGDKTPVKSDKKLYRQLLTEHDGKCSSVFEFVPTWKSTLNRDLTFTHQSIFGVRVSISMSYTTVLSNLRAMLSDEEDYYNECPQEGFFVFKVKVPQMIVKHILRHRMLSFQEMSERTNKLREYYYCDELYELYMRLQKRNCLKQIDQYDGNLWNELIYRTAQCEFDGDQQQLKIRQELLNKGSHGIAYTTLWIAGWRQDKSGWDNFFAVRTKKPAQREVIELANTIKQMMEE